MTKQQRLVLIISILASFVAFLDGSVVTVALPAMARELGGGLVLQQWVVDVYLITLGSLMLIAGSLADLFGRKKILGIGLLGFGLTSILCALAPSASFLIIARGLQGIAGALLVPSSLAIIITVFSGAKEGKAIGTWTAWTGIAYLVGPLLGGFLVDAVSWRLIFAINIVPVAITLLLLSTLRMPKHVSKDSKVDVVGAVLCAVGLGGPVYALIEQQHYGWSNPLIYLSLTVGLVAFAAFIWYERRTTQPMLPLHLFKARNFSVGNLATAAIYAGLSIGTFLITIFIQQVGHYSAIQAGMALLPVTIIMFVLSPRFGALASRFGPRFFMALGPIVGAVGFLMLFTVDQKVAYWSQVFPGILVFGLGLSMTVAPLTTAVLGAVDRHYAGIDSAVNNAVARIAGLIAIAGVGFVTGPHLSLNGFRRGLVVMVVLLVAGGIISALGIQNVQKRQQAN